MSVSFKELLHGHMINDLPIAHQQNLQDLQGRVNRCQELVNFALGHYFAFKVTSGYRTAADQQRINPKVTHSQHMLGNAVDIADPDNILKEVLRTHPTILEECGLWCEDGGATPGWCHMQSLPPKSGKRWFMP